MVKIVTADGRIATRVYANAVAADPRMEGVRVEITIARNGGLHARVHPEDEDAMNVWSHSDGSAMLSAMVELAAANDIDMCDDKEVNAWITTN